MNSAPSAKPADTRQRLLEAAARIFGSRGLEGATTREIAREAGVNEVTLFRHFQTKENLIAEVLRSTFDTQAQRLAAEDAGSARDLRAEFLRYARLYEDLLTRNILLLRTLIAEIHRHGEHEASVLQGIFGPLRSELIATIAEARRRGEVRQDVDPVIAADLLKGMIFTNVLRRASCYFAQDYPADRYLATCVEVLARGIAADRREPR